MTGPPVLPPQLLQVILNKDTPVSVSLLQIKRVQETLDNSISISVRAHVIAGTKPCDVEPPLRPVHQGRRDGTQCDSQVPEKVRDDSVVQANRDV